MHPLVLEADEMQDFPNAGWIELIETMKSGTPGAQWRCHGVSRGVRDRYYKYTMGLDPDIPFYVHRYMAMHRDTWDDKERKAKIAIYGGTADNVDYRRNIYGEHGDASNPVFVLARLMACVRMNESPWATTYNEDVYSKVKINDEQVRDAGTPLPFLQMSGAHLDSKYTSFWGGMDVGYCVDTETEMFTRRGWLRHDQVVVGDESLAINPDTGVAEWQEVTQVYRERFKDIPMVSMEGQSFSALTTPHHRWLTQPEGKPGRWRWRQTRELTSKDRIPLRAPTAPPVSPTHSDAFVELVAWFWTEGSVDRGSVEIGQSLKVHEDHAKRIQQCLLELYGDPGPVKFGPGVKSGAVWNFKDRAAGYSEGLMRYFRLSVGAAKDLLAVAPNKVVTTEFLTSLTMSQLELFISASIAADGWDSPSGMRMEQRSLERTKSFEAACVLAGLAVSTSFEPVRARWHTAILQATTVGPVKAASFPRVGHQAMTIEPVAYSGEIWCPTLKHHNWLARRNGSVYYTGNTRDPSELLIFGECDQKGQDSLLRLLARIHLMRISAEDQAEVVKAVFDFYGERLRCVALDRTGNGLPLWQMLDAGQGRNVPGHISSRIKGYNFSSKVPVEFDDRPLVGRERPEDAVIQKNVIDFATDELRKLVDARPARIELPHDQEILSEFQGQEIEYVRDEGSAAGVRKRYSGGSYHTLDGAKMMIAGRNLQLIEEAMKRPIRTEPTYDIFVGA